MKTIEELQADNQRLRDALTKIANLKWTGWDGDNGVTSIAQDALTETEVPALPTPWDNAPEWARWRAMDEDGIWVWFERVPFLWEKHITTWSVCGNALHESITPNPPRHPSWRNSLEKRP